MGCVRVDSRVVWIVVDSFALVYSIRLGGFRFGRVGLHQVASV